MTDTLTALEAAKAFVHLRTPVEYAREGIMVRDQLESAITSLTAPFDPSRLEGWVKHETIPRLWHASFMTPKGRLEYRLKRGLNLWTIEVYDHKWYTLFDGHIPTRAFFALLCGALGIKQGT